MINKPHFQEIIIHFQEELSKLRTGRAHPGMLEDLRADYYGQPTPIKQMASITVPEARQLAVTPWDKAALAPIEKAIRESELGLNPTNEGDKLRIKIPELTEERRREMLKLAGKLGEEARIKIRNIREELLRDMKKKQEAGEITEDDLKRERDLLQKTVDEFNAQIKQLSDAKEKEMLTV